MKTRCYIFAAPNFGNLLSYLNLNEVDTLSYKTVSANKESADKKWLLVDAEGETLGRLASKVAQLIRGKHKPNFTPHADCGDNVIVINAEKVQLTGNKWSEKQYIRHTGYPGGQRSLTAQELREKRPMRIVEMAVKGMLPKNKLGNQLYKNLKVVVGSEHNHEAQKPEKFNLESIK
jgi:large subunit ribosomal protein L13